MISSQGYWSSRAAREMFLQGGNIVDAAAAASFTIAVERPQSTGIGGGGFLLLRWNGKIETIDFRERAPFLATEKMYQDRRGRIIPNLSTVGILSSGTPGMVAGVLSIHKKYGVLSRARVLKPAIELAERGFIVYPHLANAISIKKDHFNPAARKVFLKQDGSPLKVGDRVIQKDLSQTLRSIARDGEKGFYRGWVAQALIKTHQQLGGLLRKKDLQKYRPVYRKPVRGTYKNYEIFSMPPPSSGGIHVIQILNILEGFQLDSPYSPLSIHRTASAMQHAFADRSKHLGDSDFVSVPVAGLTSKKYAKKIREKIKLGKASHFREVEPGHPRESDETTHFTIADHQGNVVSSTQTINGYFGSSVLVPKTGFFLNNEMDDFSAKPGAPNQFGVIGGRKNAIAPGKRPLSSMSPTIVEKNGQPVLALGSPSGSRIITCVTLTLLNMIEYGMPLSQAVSSLRYHHQWLPNEIRVEEPGFPPKTESTLKEWGYTTRKQGLGCKVQAIAFEKGKLRGVSDPRGTGLSLGSAKPPPLPDLKKLETSLEQD